MQSTALPVDSAASRGLIGPNAVTRLMQAVRAWRGVAAEHALMAQAGLTQYLLEPPRQMLDEAEVRALHDAVRALWGQQACRALTAQAGRLTADYLLAHRIPAPVQWMLRLLPAALAQRLLARAIARHAWTFAGSGRFEVRAGRRPVFVIHDNPLCRGLRLQAPACDFHAAVFTRLFRALVHPAAKAVEVACAARGEAACVFEMRW